MPFLFALPNILLNAADPSTGHVIVAELRPKSATDHNVSVALTLAPTKGWHTYWMNPGDAGSPTSVDWKLPAGWKVASLTFPDPNRMETAGIVYYGYSSPAELIATLVPPADFKAGSSVAIQGRVKWLTCTDEVCKPANGSFQTVLKVPAPSGGAWPQADLYPHPAANWKFTATRSGKTIELDIKTGSPALPKLGIPYFFSSDAAVIAHDQKQTFTFQPDTISAVLPVSPYASKAPKRLRGVLRAPQGEKWSTGFSAISIDVPIS